MVKYLVLYDIFNRNSETFRKTSNLTNRSKSHGLILRLNLLVEFKIMQLHPRPTRASKELSRLNQLPKVVFRDALSAIVGSVRYSGRALIE